MKFLKGDTESQWWWDRMGRQRDRRTQADHGQLVKGHCNIGAVASTASRKVRSTLSTFSTMTLSFLLTFCLVSGGKYACSDRCQLPNTEKIVEVLPRIEDLDSRCFELPQCGSSPSWEQGIHHLTTIIFIYNSSSRLDSGHSFMAFFITPSQVVKSCCFQNVQTSVSLQPVLACLIGWRSVCGPWHGEYDETGARSWPSLAWMEDATSLKTGTV